jgi:small subunit ribosomal protein S16
MGAKRRPFYRLVVADSGAPRDGRFIDQLGYYDPLTEPATIKIDEEKVQTWLGRGAQPSDSARSLLRRSGVLGGAAAPPAAAPAEEPAAPEQEAAAAPKSDA